MPRLLQRHGAIERYMFEIGSQGDQELTMIVTWIRFLILYEKF